MTHALCLLAILAVFHTLRVAGDVFVPIVLALLGRFAFGPVVRRLRRVGIGAPLGAVLLVAFLAGSTFAVGRMLSEPAAAWIERAPATLRQIERKIRFAQQPVVQVVEATRNVAEAADVTADEEAVVVGGPSWLSAVVERLRSLVVTLAITATLLVFLLAAGDDFTRQLALAVPGGPDRRRPPAIFDEIERDISRHLLTITLVNAGLGVAVGVALWLLGMPSPMLWGVMAGALNYVPYVGALVSAAVLAGVSLITFDEVIQTVMVVSVFVGLTSLEGFLITPYLLGRRLALSAFAVLVSLLVWSWLWGAVGALIAVPLLIALRIVCEHVAPLRRLGCLLGRDHAPVAT